MLAPLVWVFGVLLCVRMFGVGVWKGEDQGEDGVNGAEGSVTAEWEECTATW